MTVGASGVSFSIERYDDGRGSRPYTVNFTEEDSGRSYSTYTFDAAGFVTDVVVGSEEYEVLYESNGGRPLRGQTHVDRGEGAACFLLVVPRDKTK